MKTETYEDYMLKMKLIAEYLLAKWKREKADFVADRKNNRILEEEFRKKITLARFLELWRNEKTEAGRRFLIWLFMFFYAMLLEQEADQKKARELHRFFKELRIIEESRGFIQSMSNIKRQADGDKSDLIDDELNP